MILAGVDEAGLGPTLGPLVTASTAFEVPDGWKADSPWRHFADAAAEKFARGESRPVVADSKAVYAAGGMAALERSVGAFHRLVADSPRPALLFPSDDAPESIHPLYSRTLSPFPVHVGPEAVADAAHRLGEAMRKAGAAAAHLDIVALHEPILNLRFRNGLNKNQALLLETGRHLATLADKFPDREILAVVDKQGGRNDYLPFLTALFPGAWLDVLAVGAGESAYRLRRGGGNMVMRFRAKADRHSFPTALASMAAKYARERAMAELNAWFGERIPGLRPTAGYPQDAKRWLEEAGRSGGVNELGLELIVRDR